METPPGTAICWRSAVARSPSLKAESYRSTSPAAVARDHDDALELEICTSTALARVSQQVRASYPDDKRHTPSYTRGVKPFRWSPAKNRKLLAERGISFEQVVVAIESGGLLDVLAHPNSKKYPSQRLLVVTWDGYAYLVPYVDEAEHFFLKTVIPSRKATRDYLKTGDPDDTS